MSETTTKLAEAIAAEEAAERAVHEAAARLEHAKLDLAEARKRWNAAIGNRTRAEIQANQ